MDRMLRPRIPALARWHLFSAFLLAAGCGTEGGPASEASPPAVALPAVAPAVASAPPLGVLLQRPLYLKDKVARPDDMPPGATPYVPPPVPAETLRRQQLYQDAARRLVNSEGGQLSQDALESRLGALKASILGERP